MRKETKKQILDILKTVEEAIDYLKKRKEIVSLELLQDSLYCLEVIGVSFRGEISKFERLLQLLETLRVKILQAKGFPAGSHAFQQALSAIQIKLAVLRRKIEKTHAKLEIVFLPYKASMWDSLESIWRAADADPDCDAYVVPIPYYDRKSDGSFGQYHYEGNQFPDDVLVVNYETYSLENRRPDIIYIHTPYDAANYVTSIDPRFYSYELKKYTEMLVYVPYYVVSRGVFNESLITTSAFVHARRIILQSRTVCQQYIDAYNKYYKDQLEQPNKKFIALGSPKFDALINAKKENYPIPKEWIKIINNKKVVFLNISIGSMLTETERVLKKLRLLINDFGNCEDMVLWWRPHPLLENTLMSMRPNLVQKYQQIVNLYQQNCCGIYDDSPHLQRAIVWGDICYSDIKSSVFTLCCVAGKPLVEFYIGNQVITDFIEDCERYTRDNSNFDVLLRNENADGTSGIKIHAHICQEVWNEKSFSDNADI